MLAKEPDLAQARRLSDSVLLAGSGYNSGYFSSAEGPYIPGIAIPLRRR
jgi:hypothetical protein